MSDDLNDLLERVKVASATDRLPMYPRANYRLSCEIISALGEEEWAENMGSHDTGWPDVMESIDAALALSERKLLGKWVAILRTATESVLNRLIGYDKALEDLPQEITAQLLSALAEKTAREELPK